MSLKRDVAIATRRRVRAFGTAERHRYALPCQKKIQLISISLHADRVRPRIKGEGEKTGGKFALGAETA